VFGLEVFNVQITKNEERKRFLKKFKFKQI